MEWFLEYTDFDNLENRISNAVVLQSKKLNSVTESEALIEAKLEWAEISKKKNTGWDKKEYPHTPFLVFRVSIA